MKFNKRVTSSRRKQRKAYFKSPPHIRRIRMSSILSRELRNKFGIRSLPIHKDDEVLVRTGSHKGHEGKVTRVYRKKYVIFIDRIVRKKASGQVVSIGIHPSNVMITKIKTDKDREALINRLGKAKRRALKNKGTKFTDTEVEAQAPVVVENIE